MTTADLHRSITVRGSDECWPSNCRPCLRKKWNANYARRRAEKAAGGNQLTATNGETLISAVAPDESSSPTWGAQEIRRNPRST